MSAGDDVARMRALFSSGFRLGPEGLAAIVKSLTRKQRDIFSLIAVDVVEGRAPDAHNIAKRLDIHYTSAKKRLDDILRILPALVVEYHDIKTGRRNKGLDKDACANR